FGVPRMFIADSINVIISQRLLRMICPNHRKTYHPDAATLRSLGLNPDEAGQIELVRGIPAGDNFHTGYAGRTGIFELMMVENDVRRAILDGASRDALYQIAVERGLQSLEQSARNRVLAGATTVEEMHRVLL